MGKFFVRNKMSIWLCFIIVALAALMMQPSFTSFIIFPILIVLLFLLRWMAHSEGKAIVQVPNS